MSIGPDLKPDTKIQDLAALAGYVRTQKNMGHTVVHCHGRFDRLQPQDASQLRDCRSMGDVLVVTIAPDVPSSGGRNVTDEHSRTAAEAPAEPRECERASLVASVDAVDFVAISRWPGAGETVKFLAPSIHARLANPGADSPRLAAGTAGELDTPTDSALHAAAVEATSKSQSPKCGPSKSDFCDALGQEAAAYLSRLSARYSSSAVLRHVDALRPLKVALLGESILDEYVYCDALGKSGKEPVLAMRYLSRERHAGGALAIANHLSDFCQSVDLFTYLGANDSQEEAVRDHLARNVFPTFIYKADSPTIVKRRFVDAYSRSKMFAVYDLNDEALSSSEEDALCAAVEARIADCDLVIAADFGHGLITQPLIDVLSEKARFLAVNTQLNAANIGYHTISRYPRADFVSIHEGEIRLDSRSRNGDLRLLMRNLADRLSCPTVMVTRGKNGSLLYHQRDGFVQCPAFATRIVDRVGAGDAVFALTSLCAVRGLAGDLLSFLGNVVGAQAVTIVGNRASVDRQRLVHALDGLLKPFQTHSGAMVA